MKPAKFYAYIAAMAGYVAMLSKTGAGLDHFYFFAEPLTNKKPWRRLFVYCMTIP